jgi:hypothetical protein
MVFGPLYRPLYFFTYPLSPRLLYTKCLLPTVAPVCVGMPWDHPRWRGRGAGAAAVRTGGNRAGVPHRSQPWGSRGPGQGRPRYTLAPGGDFIIFIIILEEMLQRLFSKNIKDFFSRFLCVKIKFYGSCCRWNVCCLHVSTSTECVCFQQQNTECLHQVTSNFIIFQIWKGEFL